MYNINILQVKGMLLLTKTKICITSETTSSGGGTKFDIFMYASFAVVFAWIGFNSLFEGNLMHSFFGFLLAFIDAVITISNIKKYKKNKKALTSLEK